MTTREEFETDLAEAEAHLAKAVANVTTANDVTRANTDLSAPVSSLADLETDVAKARAQCLKVRAAINSLNRTEGKPIAYGRKPKGDRRRRANAPLSRTYTDRRMAEDRRLARTNSADLSGAALIAAPDGWTNRLDRGAARCPKRWSAATPLDRDARQQSAHIDERLARAAENSAASQFRPRNETGGFNGHFLAQETGTSNSPSEQVLAWRSIQLLALVLAYLQYHLIDASLQIAFLPSVTVLLAR